MFNRVGDFLQPRTSKNETRAERRAYARKAYKLAKRMRKDLEKDPELVEKLRQGATTIKKPIE